jgi:choline dehydrogenase-like flavoprotein
VDAGPEPVSGMKQERVIAARVDADLHGEGPWDAVVIGTGMGGAAAGHRLTQAGLRVLFLEKGEAALAPGLDAGMVDDPDLRRRAGHWPDRVRLELDGSGSDVLLPLGMGVGGSTTLYAAALERFERSDIEDAPELPHPTGGWPVPWIRWLRYYAEAERYLRVRTDPDPSRAGDAVLLGLPPASEVDQEFADILRGNGLHPYRLHVGIGYRPGCTECGGHRCLHRCKSDARTIFIEPALASGRAELRAGCDVLRLDADGERVRRVVYRRGDRKETVSARIIVLAAGAYGSPAILLRSANDWWPTGLANEADLVGRNLMFHANEWLAVWPTAKRSTAGPRKTIGLRDHYAKGGLRLGAVQSTGLSAGFGNICAFLKARLELSRLRRVPGLEKLLKVGALVAVRLFGNASIFVMLVEDFGMPENRVSLDPYDPARITLHYTVPADLRRRARLARSLLKRSFRGARALSLQGDVQLNLGHACGTCRFGSDPDTSVLDPDCRAHGVDNLYVVDASFMPSSGGANPALTIAANALRVGDAIAARLRAEAAIRRVEAVGA